MATRTWDDGAGDGTFITAANWSADTAPVDGDTAKIAASARDITAADHSSIELAAFHILNGWTGQNIGSVSGTLKIDATLLEIVTSGFGAINLEGIYDNVYARALGGRNLRFGPTSDIGNLYAGSSGSIYVDTGAKLAFFQSAGANARIMGDTSTPDDLELIVPRGCVVECYRRVARAYVEGTLYMRGAAEGDISAGTSKIVVASTGTLNLESTGNYDEIYVNPSGKLFGGKQPGGASKPTITKIIVADGARVSVPAALWTVTEYAYSGGTEDVGAGP